MFTNNIKIKGVINHFLLVFVLLIHCNSFAVDLLTDKGFEQFIQKVGALKDTNSTEAHEYLQQHFDRAEQIPLKNRLIFYKYLAEVYNDLGEFQKTRDITNKALLLAKNLSNPTIVSAELYYAKGFSFESHGDFTHAIKDYQNGLEISESLNDKKFSSTGLINLGAIYYLTES